MELTANHPHPEKGCSAAGRFSRYRQPCSCGTVRLLRPLAHLEAKIAPANPSLSYGTKPSIDNLPQEVIERIHASVLYLQHALDQGHSVYGMPRVSHTSLALAHASQESPPGLVAAPIPVPRIQTPFK